MFTIWLQHKEQGIMTVEAENVSSFVALCQTEEGDWQLVCPKGYTEEQIQAIAKAFYESTQKGASDAGADHSREQTEPR